MANEVVEEYRTKKKKGWILKLDIEKVFHQVDCQFLEKVLKGKVLPPLDLLDYGLCNTPKVLDFH